MEEDNNGETMGEGEGASLSLLQKSLLVSGNMTNPGLPVPEAHPGSRKMELTLCLIKPDAMEHADEIVSILCREGFAVLQVKSDGIPPSTLEDTDFKHY